MKTSRYCYFTVSSQWLKRPVNFLHLLILLINYCKFVYSWWPNCILMKMMSYCSRSNDQWIEITVVGNDCSSLSLVFESVEDLKGRWKGVLYGREESNICKEVGVDTFGISIGLDMPCSKPEHLGWIISVESITITCFQLKNFSKSVLLVHFAHLFGTQHLTPSVTYTTLYVLVITFSSCPGSQYFNPFWLRHIVNM